MTPADDDDDDDDDDDRRWWARLVPTCDVSRECAHVDRAALARDAAGNLTTLPNDAPMRGPEVKLRLKSCVLGRVVMNKDGTARAKSQPADVALDVPSGACVCDGSMTTTTTTTEATEAFLKAACSLRAYWSIR